MKKKILVTLLTIIVTVPMFMTGITTAQAAVDTSLFPDHPVYENEPEGAALIEKLGYPIADIDANGQIMAIIDSDGTRYDLPAADPWDRVDKQKVIDSTISFNLNHGGFVSGVSSLISDEEQYKNIAIYEANHAAAQTTEEPVAEEPAAVEEAQPSNESDTIVVESPEPAIAPEGPTTALESVSNSIGLKSLNADDTKADAKTEDTKEHKYSSNPIIATFQKIGGGFLYIVDAVTDKIIGILSWF